MVFLGLPAAWCRLCPVNNFLNEQTMKPLLRCTPRVDLEELASYGQPHPSTWWALDGKWQVCPVPSPGGDRRAKDKKSAATALSELDPVGSSSSAGSGKEPKEERGGQAESAASGEL